MSVVLMAASTFGLLYYVDLLTPFNFAITDIIRYTNYMLLGLGIVTVIAAVLTWIMIRKPRTITLLLKIHSFLKRGSGEYFICPDVPDQSMQTIIRRSLYGSILVSGIALTIMSFDLMGTATEADILRFGAIVMIVSVFILPLTVMQLYYAPWVIKDSGLFHLDTRDRSLSNVGDDLEDLLEFVAGIDIILVWIELTINTELWVAPFVIFIMLGPLFAILLNFTIIFTMEKDKATLAMINLLLERYGVPEMVNSPDYIRKRVISLIDKRMLVEEVVESEAVPLTVHDTPEHPQSVPELLDEFGHISAETEATEEMPISAARESLAQEEVEGEEAIAATELSSSRKRKVEKADHK